VKIEKDGRGVDRLPLAQHPEGRVTKPR
jgi:hypothetical protein